jgi:hypothetical protein
MKVRAKFRCSTITLMQTYLYDKDAGQSVPAPARSIVLEPVYGQGDPAHENTKFWQATPSGRIEMSIVNATAAECFEVGKEYFVDFTPAE